MKLMIGWLHERLWFGDTTVQWAGALCLTAVVTLLLGALCRHLKARLEILAPATEALVDNLVLDALRRTRLFSRAAAGIWAGASLITIPEPAATHLSTILLVIFVVQIGLWVSGLVRYLIEVELERRAPDDGVEHRTGRNVLRAVATAFIWTLVILFCADNTPFIEVKNLWASLAIPGLAVSLAGQQIGSDLFAAGTIMLDQPFLVGDFLIVDGFRGTVERIGVRSTRLRSLDGEEMIFSNSDLTRSRIRNYKNMSERRMHFELAVRHDTPAKKVETLATALERIVNQTRKARFDRAHWHAFGTHALLFEVVFYAQDPSLNGAMDIQQRVLLGVLNHLEQEEITLAVGTALRMAQDDRVVPKSVVKGPSSAASSTVA